MSQSLNTGITVPPLPRNERAHAFGLDALPATFGEGFGAQFDDQMVRNPTASIWRMLDRAQYFPSTDEFGNESPARTPSRILTPQEANDQYGIPGHLKFDADTPEPIAQELKTLKTREVERQDTMRRAQAGIGTALSAGLVASILDPLNVASAFIPVVGEARYAAMVARLGVTGARATRGAIEGAVGAAVVEPFTLAAASYEQADYDAADSLASIAFGTVLGSGLHVAGGAVKDRFVTAVDNLPAADKEALLRTSVAQVAEGRPVEVGDLLRQRLLGNVGEPLDKVFDDLLPPELRTMKAAEAAAPERMGPDATAFALKKQVDAVGKQADTAEAALARLVDERKGVVETPNQPLVDALAETKTVAAEARKELADAKINLDRASRRANTLRDSGVGDADPKLVRAIEQEQAAKERFSAADEAAEAVEMKAETVKTELANYKANEAKRVGDRQSALDTQIERAKAEAEAQKRNLQDVLTAADAEREGRMIEFRSQLEQARAQATEALRVKLAEAAAGPRIKMEPEGERFLADIERRFSEVQARPEAIADELKAVEAEIEYLEGALSPGPGLVARNTKGGREERLDIGKEPEAAVFWERVEKLQALADKLSDDLGIPSVERIGLNTSRGARGTYLYAHTNDPGQIKLEPLRDESSFVALFTHEYGHHVQNMVWSELDVATKARILDDFFRSKDTNSDNPRRTARGAQAPLAGFADSDGYYFRSQFSEWFAEQVSRWLTTKAKPVGVIETFFNKIAQFWKALYNSVAEKFDIVPLYRSVEDLLEDMSSADTRWVPVKGGISVAEREATIASDAVHSAKWHLEENYRDKDGFPNTPAARAEWTEGRVSFAKDIETALERDSGGSTADGRAVAANADEAPTPTTYAEQEANVYAKAWEEAVACRIRKA